MFYFLLFGAILLANLVKTNVNITCYECNGCTSTPMKISSGNRLCFRFQVNCPSADIHVNDLMGDRLHPHYSASNCGQTLSYKLNDTSACTIAYHCCYTDKCNTYENPLLSSTSSSLYILNRIIIIFSILLLLYHRFSL